MDTIKLSALKLTQPIGEFFVGTLPAKTLKNLAMRDVRRMTNREIEEHSGIQRGLSESRMREIRQYIGTVDASFPNSIILNLDSSYVVSQQSLPVNCEAGRELVCFEIRADESTFKIIDGQHRLAGFDDENSASFDLIVAFFVDLAVEEQAFLFSTINLTQTKVNKSLVYDLFDVSETRSPQKTAHLIAKAMNNEQQSPFYHRLKLLGIQPKMDGEVLYTAPLTQGTFVGRLIPLISADPISDRDAEKRGARPSVRGDEIADGLIFRPFYLEDKDWAILKVMQNYFSALAYVFKDEWQRLDSPLAKTIGYGALMRLLVPFYQEGTNQRDVSYGYFERRFERIYRNFKSTGLPMDFERFPASGSGETKFFRQLEQWAMA